jgi:Mg-chelatase subunit ChlD
MKTRLLTLLFLLTAGASLALAQDVAPVESKTPAAKPQRPPDIIELVIPGNRPMTTWIAFVVDSSGSMDNSGRMGMAIKFATDILGQGVDEMKVALLAFKGSHERWPGVPHDGLGPAPPEGWTEFPGVTQLQSAEKWLNSQGAHGITNPSSALREALAEEIEDLTVVIITDGDFNGDDFKNAVAVGQASRESRGRKKATIIVVGIGEESVKRQHMIDVGKSEGGGLFVIKRPKPF